MILASASPRRKELLERVGFDLVLVPTNIDESRLADEDPLSMVQRLAYEKACSALDAYGPLSAGEVLLAADTIVWMGDSIYGKPADSEDACLMLRELSGKTHHVSTGVCLFLGTQDSQPTRRLVVQTSNVTFRTLDDDEIRAYVQTGEPIDKAGAYAIQGGARKFVSSLEGDYDNVVGLPVTRVLEELASMRVECGIPLSVTQIPGFVAANSTNAEGGTGCTVIVCPEGATAGVDVRGGAPATRETDLLRPAETVQELHAVILAGGSVYGLAASCGVTEELERAGIGLNVGVGIAPIVSGACLFDLPVGDPSCRPTMADGASAVAKALEQVNVAPIERAPLERGNVGAGTGCTVGKLNGPMHAMKCGLGEAVRFAGSLVCGAVAAVNACGDVVNPHTGQILAGQLADDGQTLQSTKQTLLSRTAAMPLDSPQEPFPRTNTTISCVVTNARLTKAEVTKVAQMAADAYAHAISPTHTTNDGDTVFVMAKGEVQVPVDVVGALATQALEDAIVDGALRAQSAYGLKAACDLSR